MKFPVRRLEWIEKLVLNEMISYARLDNTLDDFGYGGEIGDWSVVRKIFFVLRRGVIIDCFSQGSFRGGTRGNTVPIVEKLPERMRTAFPLLKCLRTHRNATLL